MKHYACTDIHAHWNTFKSFIDTLEKDDKVYFLGDAEDKGPDPLVCLLYMMEDPRFTFIVGNHDYMLWDNIDFIKKHGYPDRENFSVWHDGNYGKATFDAFMSYDEKTQKDILDFIYKSPLFLYGETIEGRIFDFCHSYMWKRKDFHNTESIETVGREYAEWFVWSRPDFPPYRVCGNEEHIVVAGHTITYNINHKVPLEIYHDEEKIEDSKYINLDCGMAADNKDLSRFAVLCLEDLSVKYFPMI